MPNKEILTSLLKTVQAFFEERERERRLDLRFLRKQCALEDFIALEECLNHDNTVDLAEFRKKFLDYYHQQFPLNPHYLEIARILFAKETLGDLLRYILHPSVKLMGLDFLVSKRKFIINVVEQDFETLKESANVTLLEHFVFIDGLLFDVRDIASFDFNLHQTFYSQIKERYPTLSQAIYSHNHGLKALKTHLDNDTVYLATPLSVINELVRRLRAGGTSVTGLPEASNDAKVAFTEFKEYLESLPVDLKAIFESRFSEVITHLNNGNCVEIAAGMFERQLWQAFNGFNDPLLVTAPTISIEKDLALYRSLKSLETRSTRNDEVVPITRVFELPLKVIVPFLNTREIQQALLKAAQFDPELFAALLDLLSALDKEDQSFVLQATEGNGYNALHLVAQYQPSAIPAILAVIAGFPEPRGFELLQSRQGDGYNALHLAVQYQPSAVPAILAVIAGFTKTQRVELLQARQRNGFNALYLAAQYQVTVVADILEAMSDFSLGVQCALLEKISTTEVNQYRSRLITDAMARLDDSSPMESKIKALLNSMDFPDKIKLQLTVLGIYAELKTPDSHEEVYLSPRVRFIKVLQEIMLKGLLFQSVLIPKLFDLSSLFNEDEQISLLQAISENGYNALHLAFRYQPSVVPAILAVIAGFPEPRGFELLQSRQGDGYNALHLAAQYQPSAVPAILAVIAGFTQTQRVELLQSRQVNGCNALYLAAQFQGDVVADILEAMSDFSLGVQCALLERINTTEVNQYRSRLVTDAMARLDDSSPMESKIKALLSSMDFPDKIKLQLTVLGIYAELKTPDSHEEGYLSPRVRFIKVLQEIVLKGAQFQPVLIPKLFDLSSLFNEDEQISLLLAISEAGYNALHLAVRYQPSVVPAILAVIAGFPEPRGFELLQLRQGIGYNALHLAAQYQPSVVPAILAVIAGFTQTHRVELLQSRQGNGFNALYLAAQYQGDVVADILVAMSDFSLGVQCALLERINTTEVNQYRSRLVTDAMARLDDSSPMESKIKALLSSMDFPDKIKLQLTVLGIYAELKTPDSHEEGYLSPRVWFIKVLQGIMLKGAQFQPVLIPKLFDLSSLFNEDEQISLFQAVAEAGNNALHLAVRYQPSVVPAILAVIAGFPEPRGFELLQLRQAIGYNALHLAARYQPSVVPAILAVIAGFTQTHRVELLQSQQGNGYNALHLAAQTQPSAVPALLAWIAGFSMPERIKLFQSTQNNGFTVLKIMASFNPSLMTDLLNAISDFPLIVQYTLFDNTMSVEQKNQCKILMLSNVIARLRDEVSIERRLKKWLNTRILPSRNAAKMEIIHAYEEIKNSGDDIRLAVVTALDNPQSRLSQAFKGQERFRFFTSIQGSLLLSRVKAYLTKLDLDTNEKRQEKPHTIGV